MSVADAPEGVRIRILGDTIAYAPDGSLLRLSRMQRIMLCRLALGGVVHISELADAVWGSDAPSTARASLQNQVGRLRALLGPEAIATCDDGYQLAVPTDADLGHELVLRAESAHAAGDAETVFDACTRALALIRGEPCADLMDVRDAVLPRRAIHTWIRIAEDLQVASALSLGRTSLALFRAEELYEREPLDEGRATLLARALAEAGRRGDALGIIDQVRENLRTELGLDLSGELVALRASLLEPAPSVAMAPSRFVGRETQLQRARQAVADDRSLVVTAEPGGGV